MSIIEAVLEVHTLLTRSCPAHAFGGALALAHYAETPSLIPNYVAGGVAAPT